jgi:Holliday junction resolvase RusA-like endonuclease
MHRSRRYVAWPQEAGRELKLLRPCKIRAQWPSLSPPAKPDKRKRDLDNIASKAILDLMVAHQVISDDHLVVKVTGDPGPPQSRVAPCGLPSSQLW